MLLDLNTFGIEEEYSRPFNLPILSLYSQQEPNFLKAKEEFESGDMRASLKLLTQEESLDESLLKAIIYLKEGAVLKAMEAAKKATWIANKYHSHFHFLGFDLNRQEFKKTGDEAFLKKAEFLYKPGLETCEDVNFTPLIGGKNLCIFKPFGEVSIEDVEVEHFNFHLSAALSHFIHGLCFKIMLKPETARVEFEKALKMEPKNFFNSQIASILRNT